MLKQWGEGSRRKGREEERNRRAGKWPKKLCLELRYVSTSTQSEMKRERERENRESERAPTIEVKLNGQGMGPKQTGECQSGFSLRFFATVPQLRLPLTLSLFAPSLCLDENKTKHNVNT